MKSCRICNGLDINYDKKVFERLSPNDANTYNSVVTVPTKTVQ